MKAKGSRDHDPVSKLYAKALFELAHEKGELDAVTKDFSDLIEMLRESPQLAQALSAFMFSVQEREKLATEIAQKSQLHAHVLRFLYLLIAKGRVQLLEPIYEAYRLLVDQSKGTVRGTVTTVAALSDSESAELSKAFERKFSKKVILDSVLDKEILGGLIVKIQGLTFDGSLKTTIRRLKETLERQSV